jgi:hypothetical protein
VTRDVHSEAAWWTAKVTAAANRIARETPEEELDSNVRRAGAKEMRYWEDELLELTEVADDEEEKRMSLAG